MQCCARFCVSTGETASRSVPGHGVTFHALPSDSHLRAAWLRALGRQDTPLPDPAVVCSQHFLNDDMYETESGSRQIRPGAIPSMVQVTRPDIKTINRTKHQLKSNMTMKVLAPDHCDLQVLENRPRESAYTIYADVVKTEANDELMLVDEDMEVIHEDDHADGVNDDTVLATDHCDLHVLENIQRQSAYTIYTDVVKTEANDELMLVDEDMEVIHEDDHADGVNDDTVLATDHCDLHVLENIQRQSAYTIYTDVVKTEANDELMLVDEDMEVIHEDDHADVVNDDYDEFVACSIKLEAQLLDDAILKANRKAAVSTQVAVTQDIFKCESARYQCTLCLEEFVLAHTYLQHLKTHLQNGAAADDPQQLSEDPRQLIDEPQQLSDDPHPSADWPPTSVALPARRATNNGTKVPPAEEDYSHDERGVAADDVSCLATSQNKVPTTLNNPNLSSLQIKTLCSNNDVNVPYNNSPANVERKLFYCDVCPKMFKQKRSLIKHIETHTQVMQCKCKNENALMKHTNAHTASVHCICIAHKPFACELCKYKFSQKRQLVAHMRTHTGDKPFACELCKYKCSQECNLVRHMRTHNGDKRFTCELCKFKFSHKCSLVTHMRTHTGDKPFACELCKYKCSLKNSLVFHMRTHTGEKPFACELCNCKFSRKGNLARHMRTHTGDKPFNL